MDASAHDLLLVGGGAVGVRPTIATVELNVKHSIVPCAATLFPRKAAQPVSSTGYRPTLHTTPFQVVTGVVIRKRSRPLSKKRLCSLCDSRVVALHSRNRLLKTMT